MRHGALKQALSVVKLLQKEGIWYNVYNIEEELGMSHSNAKRLLKIISEALPGIIETKKERARFQYGGPMTRWYRFNPRLPSPPAE